MDVALEISGLTFAYSNGTAALADLSLTVEKGETVVFIGPNGAILANGEPRKILTDEALLQSGGLELPLLMRYYLALQARQEG